MNNLHIKNSYMTWNPSVMQACILSNCYTEYQSWDAENVLHRPMWTMHVEWWLHNVGYYTTKPFCFIESMQHINNRCKDVDLQEWKS